MTCPNCGKSFDVGNKCPHCKIDTVLFKGIENLSNKLYNKGLERLSMMDISGGIQELTRSVIVNKHNVRARNLLGLALFEIGHIGEALKHWVISQSMLREKNPVKLYFDKLDKNTRAFERLNEAVVMYNHALDYIRQNSDDLAVIQLKKALEYNPRFVDALNLLALCYLQQKNRQQAAAAMERVFAIDARNPIALRYYNILNPGRPRPRPMPPRQVPPPAPPPPKPVDTGPFKPVVTIKEKKSSLFHVVGILSFIIGALCIAAFGYFLYIPALERQHNIEIQNERREAENAAAAHQDEIDAQEIVETGLRRQIEEMERVISGLEAANTNADRTIRVFVANERYRAGTIEDIRAAADMLELLSPFEGLHVDTVALANRIRASAGLQLANHYTTTGIAAYDANDFDRALLLLEDAYKFIQPDNAQYPHLLYHLGTLYFNANNRQTEALAILTDLTGLEGYGDLPSNPWNARRNSVQHMLDNLRA